MDKPDIAIKIRRKWFLAPNSVLAINWDEYRFSNPNGRLTVRHKAIRWDVIRLA
jgi:hypothetical protein